MAFREHVAIISEGGGSRLSPFPKLGAADSKKKGRGVQGKRGTGGNGGSGASRQTGRLKASSPGAMSHILFRGSKGGVEGRLPGEVKFLHGQFFGNLVLDCTWRTLRGVLLSMCSCRCATRVNHS